jgi:hypothetical protein
MKKTLGSIALILCSFHVHAMDLNPRTVECEWSYHNKPLAPDLCHIIGSGLGMGGVDLMAVRIGNKGYTYFFEDNHAAVHLGDTVDTKKIWEGEVEMDEIACRRNGPIVQRYRVSDGLTLCLY